jgi:hypothetical protein
MLGVKKLGKGFMLVDLKNPKLDILTERNPQ